MRAMAMASRFLATFLRGGTVGEPCRLVMHTEIGLVEVDRYSARGRSVGPILLVHGMSLRGHRDPRMMACAHAFAACGHTVYLPALPLVARTRIDTRTIDRVGAMIRLLGARRPVPIFAVSFSAGISLRASMRPDVAPFAGPICTLGTFADAEGAFRYILEDPSADPYGSLVAWRNYLEYLPPPYHSDGVRRALDEAIADDGLVRARPHLPVLLHSLSAGDRARFLELTTDQAFRSRWCRRLLTHRHRVDELSVLEHADDLRSPLTLIHGRYDDVIPSEQSVLLGTRLRARGHDVLVEITPLIGHGDSTLTPQFVSHLRGLSRAFSNFFGHVLEL